MQNFITIAREVFDAATRKGQLHITDEAGSDMLVGFFVPATPVLALGKALLELDIGGDNPFVTLPEHAVVKADKKGKALSVEIPIGVWNECYPFFESLRERGLT